MRHELDTALDQCLAWFRAGRSMEACLEHYPEFAEELQPLLVLALQVSRVSIPPVPATARAAGQSRMLAAYDKKAERAAQTHPIFWHAKRLSWALVPGRPGSLRPAWTSVLAVLIVLVVATAAVTVASSAGSLPGDALYPVKLATQRLQLALTLNPLAHGLLADRYDVQRRLDVQAVLKRGGRATVEFQGTLERMEESLWTVGGLPIALRETTVIVGTPYLGAEVRVGGELPGDGQLVALWVRIESEGQPSPTPTARATHTAPPAATPTPTRTPTPPSTLVPAQSPEGAGTPALDGTRELAETPETSTPEPATTTEEEESPTPTAMPEQSEPQDDEHTPEPSEKAGPGEIPGHEGSEGGETPADDGEPGGDEEPEEGSTPVNDGEPGEDEEPEDEERPVDDDGPEHGGTPEPDSTPDD